MSWYYILYTIVYYARYFQNNKCIGNSVFTAFWRIARCPHETCARINPSFLFSHANAKIFKNRFRPISWFTFASPADFYSLYVANRSLSPLQLDMERIRHFRIAQEAAKVEFSMRVFRKILLKKSCLAYLDSI